MHRFFIPPHWINSDQVTFQNPVAHQISHVLRLRLGDAVIVLDNLGYEYDVDLTACGTVAQGQVMARRRAGNEPGCLVSMYLSLTQREKFEWMLQKCTEVGAVEFIPMVTGRSLVGRSQGIEEAWTLKKNERWARIIQEAAEQSGRGRLPVLHRPLSFKDAVDSAREKADQAYIPYEGEKSRGLVQAIDLAQGAPQRLALLIGPEGGFSGEEIELAESAGIFPVSLGRRILRMETAAIVALALAINALELRASNDNTHVIQAKPGSDQEHTDHPG